MAPSDTIKYDVEIKTYDKPQRVSKDTKKILETAGMIEGGKVNIKGVSAKMLRQMKQEFVSCPILKTDVTFLECFVCQNFQSRVRGKVLCKGNPL